MTSAEFSCAMHKLIDPKYTMSSEMMLELVEKKFTSNNTDTLIWIDTLTDILYCFERGYPKAGKDRIRTLIDQLKTGKSKPV